MNCIFVKDCIINLDNVAAILKEGDEKRPIIRFVLPSDESKGIKYDSIKERDSAFDNLLLATYPRAI